MRVHLANDILRSITLTLITMSNHRNMRSILKLKIHVNVFGDPEYSLLKSQTA